MIEVEKKIKLEKSHLSEIEKNGTFLSTKKFTDIYFDTATFHYTLNDMWFRKREKAFELKVGVNKEGDLIDLYDEITEEQAIFQALKIEEEDSLEAALKNNGIVPFCTFETTRTKYQYGPYIIDIDHADFGTMTYDVAEIELLVATKEEISHAETVIEKLLAQFKIDPKQRLLGKLPYYLSQESKDHYTALVKAKVIRL